MNTQQKKAQLLDKILASHRLPGDELLYLDTPSGPYAIKAWKLSGTNPIPQPEQRGKIEQIMEKDIWKGNPDRRAELNKILHRR